jgi:hypothetical protein
MRIQCERIAMGTTRDIESPTPFKRNTSEPIAGRHWL